MKTIAATLDRLLLREPYSSQKRDYRSASGFRFHGCFQMTIRATTDASICIGLVM